MTDPALLRRDPPQHRDVVGQDRAQRRDAHRAAVARIRRLRAGRLPRRAGRQAKRRAPGPRPSPDVATLAHERCQPARESRWTPPSSVADAQQQLARKLGVVGVLTERKIRVSALAGAPREEGVANIGRRGLRWLSLDDESQRVAERLTQQRARDAIRSGEAQAACTGTRKKSAAPRASVRARTAGPIAPRGSVRSTQPVATAAPGMP